MEYVPDCLELEGLRIVSAQALFSSTESERCMPQLLDSCVESMLDGWKTDPPSKPKRFKRGDDMVPLNTPEDAKSAAFAMCTTSLKSAGKLSFGDEGYYLSDEVLFPNPVMTAWAFTNKPFVQGLDPLSFVDESGSEWVEGESAGKKLIKVPLLILGKWKHAMGILNFTKEFVQKLQESFKSGVAGHQISADARHRDTLGALAWAVGKFVFEINKQGKEQWSLLAEPTPQGEQFVKDKVYRYGSIEFHPDFQNRSVKQALSADGISGEWSEDLALQATSIDRTEFPEYYEERDVTKEDTNSTEVTPEQQLAQLTSQVAAFQAERDASQLEIKSRDERIVGLERLAIERFVESLCLQAKAYRDPAKRPHSAVFLQWLRSVLTCSEIDEGEKAIKLEDARDTGQIHAYYRRSIAWLAENKPGDGPLDTSISTEGSQKRPGQNEDEAELSEGELALMDEGWTLAVPGG